MKKKEWKFVYDEEVCDTLGSNFMGIITDGKRFLFFQALPDEDQNDERCYIYSVVRVRNCPIRGLKQMMNCCWKP